MAFLQAQGAISNRAEMARTFNCGVGMVLASTRQCRRSHAARGRGRNRHARGPHRGWREQAAPCAARPALGRARTAGRRRILADHARRPPRPRSPSSSRAPAPIWRRCFMPAACPVRLMKSCWSLPTMPTPKGWSWRGSEGVATFALSHKGHEPARSRCRDGEGRRRCRRAIYRAGGIHAHPDPRLRRALGRPDAQYPPLAAAPNIRARHLCARSKRAMPWRRSVHVVTEELDAGEILGQIADCDNARGHARHAGRARPPCRTPALSPRARRLRIARQRSAAPARALRTLGAGPATNA